MLNRRRQNKKSLLSRLIVFAIAIALISTVGLKLAIWTIHFITDFTISENTDGALNSGDFFEPPDITEIPEATNSATIRVSGTAPQNSTVFIYVNNVKRKQTKVSDDGTFSSLLNLNRSSNTIFVEAQNEETKESRRSDNYSVRYLEEGPELIIETPTDGQFTGSSEIEVKGSVNADSTVKISGNPVVVNTAGQFTALISLNPGENIINIVAQDIAGSEEEINLKVIYEP